MALRNEVKTPPLTTEEKAWCKKLEMLLLSAPARFKCHVNIDSPEQIIASLSSSLITEAEEVEDHTSPSDPIKLSNRQKQLILMLDQGLSNREISEKLDITEHTVKVHLWRMYRRLGVNSRTQALHFARTHALLGI